LIIILAVVPATVYCDIEKEKRYTTHKELVLLLVCNKIVARENVLTQLEAELRSCFSVA
jgi:hypothetical protein